MYDVVCVAAVRTFFYKSLYSQSALCYEQQLGLPVYCKINLTTEVVWLAIETVL